MNRRGREARGSRFLRSTFDLGGETTFFSRLGCDRREDFVVARFEFGVRSAFFRLGRFDFELRFVIVPTIVGDGFGAELGREREHWIDCRMRRRVVRSGIRVFRDFCLRRRGIWKRLRIGVEFFVAEAAEHFENFAPCGEHSPTPLFVFLHRPHEFHLGVGIIAFARGGIDEPPATARLPRRRGSQRLFAGSAIGPFVVG